MKVFDDFTKGCNTESINRDILLEGFFKEMVGPCLKTQKMFQESMNQFRYQVKFRFQFDAKKGWVKIKRYKGVLLTDVNVVGPVVVGF